MMTAAPQPPVKEEVAQVTHIAPVSTPSIPPIHVHVNQPRDYCPPWGHGRPRQRGVLPRRVEWRGPPRQQPRHQGQDPPQQSRPATRWSNQWQHLLGMQPSWTGKMGLPSQYLDRTISRLATIGVPRGVPIGDNVTTHHTGSTRRTHHTSHYQLTTTFIYGGFRYNILLHW